MENKNVARLANSCLDNIEPLTNVNVNTIGLDNWQLPSNQLNSNLTSINNPKNYSHTHSLSATIIGHEFPQPSQNDQLIHHQIPSSITHENTFLDSMQNSMHCHVKYFEQLLDTPIHPCVCCHKLCFRK